MADTGCQICLAGINAINCLGIIAKNLIRATMQMHAANNVGINILGTITLWFSGHSQSGKLLETRQLTYVTNCSSKVFISREACSELSMIHRHFPTIGEVMPSNNATSGAAHIQQPYPTASLSTPPSNDTGLTVPCSCPKCQLPPPKPDTIPFPPTEENRKKLQAWLIDYYRSSTFNMCEHQPLPMTEGPPMRLMIDPEATPVAHHKPLPVPFTLAGGNKGRAWSGCPPWCHQSSTNWRTGHLVPSNGCLPKEEWQTKEDSRLPSPQPACHTWDPPHAVPIPPGLLQPTQHKEDHLRRMEWLPQRTSACRWPPPHYLHYSMGTLPLLHCSSRIYCLRRWIHTSLWWDSCPHPPKDYVCWWLPFVVQLYWREHLAGGKLARHLWL